jgi:hypothetical protein
VIVNLLIDTRLSIIEFMTLTCKLKANIETHGKRMVFRQMSNVGINIADILL